MFDLPSNNRHLLSRWEPNKCSFILQFISPTDPFTLKHMISKNWETEEELLPSGHQAPKLKLGLITSSWLHLIISKIFTIHHYPYCCYVYIPCTTCLHIPLAYPCLYYYYYLLSPEYTVLRILFYCTFYSSLFFIPIFYFLPILCIFSCVCVTYNCTVHWADLTYISLLIIFCRIEYVTNKTLNPPWLYLILHNQIKILSRLLVIQLYYI